MLLNKQEIVTDRWSFLWGNNKISNDWSIQTPIIQVCRYEYTPVRLSF
jgi:hypothetical protein